MTTEPDASSDAARPVAALTGQFLHQRAAIRRPRPSVRIDELDAVDTTGEGGDDRGGETSDHSEEEDAE